MEGTLQFLIAFLVPAAVILLPLYWRAAERRQLLGVIQAAAESGKPVPVELLDGLTKGLGARPTRNQDVRRGAFMVAIAIGLCIIGYAAYRGLAASGVEGNVATGVIIISLAAIPGCVGVAYILLGLGTRAPPEG